PLYGVTRAPERRPQHRFGDLVDDRLAGLERERGHRTRRHLAHQCLDEGVEAEVLAIAGVDAPRLEMHEDLADLFGGTTANDDVRLRPEHDRTIDRPADLGLGDRV